ncbi:hypothetical protein OXX79_007127, partial [Metschnikowia pulcherrima]
KRSVHTDACPILRSQGAGENRPNDNKYAGSQGIALSMAPYIEQDRQFVDKKQGMWVEPELMVAESRATAILQAKYRAYRQMAAWQQSFHGTMGEL